MTGEGSARVSALIDDVAGAILDPNSIRCEVTAMVRPRVWADSDSWPARVDRHGDVRHPFWVPLEMIKRARQRDAHVEVFHFTPAIEAAVRIPPQPCLIHGEHLSIREDDRALDDVLKLADIPGPVIGSKQLERRSIDAPDLLAGLLGKALDQILDEQGDVVGSVAERGDFDGKDIQPVVKVLAELSLRDGALQVAIACGQDAHVHGKRPVASDPLELS